MKDVIKISIGVVLTVVLTVFTLGIINGSTGKNYSVKDIPGVGWVVKATDSAGRTIGEKMRKTPPQQTQPQSQTNPAN